MSARLNAVNIMLRTVGMQSLNALDSNDHDAQRAEVVLDATTKLLGTAPYQHNTDEVTLTTNADSEIEIPSTYRDVRFKNNQDRLTVRNGIVWDTKEAEAWTQDTTVYATLEIAFENLPAPFQEWFAREAAVVFAQEILGDVPHLAERERIAAKAMALNSEQYDLGNYTGTSDIKGARFA